MQIILLFHLSFIVAYIRSDAYHLSFWERNNMFFENEGQKVVENKVKRIIVFSPSLSYFHLRIVGWEFNCLKIRYDNYL